MGFYSLPELYYDSVRGWRLVMLWLFTLLLKDCQHVFANRDTRRTPSFSFFSPFSLPFRTNYMHWDFGRVSQVDNRYEILQLRLLYDLLDWTTPNFLLIVTEYLKSSSSKMSSVMLIVSICWCQVSCSSCHYVSDSVFWNFLSFTHLYRGGELLSDIPELQPTELLSDIPELQLLQPVKTSSMRTLSQTHVAITCQVVNTSLLPTLGVAWEHI
jgi:hypothetical protein